MPSKPGQAHLTSTLTPQPASAGLPREPRAWRLLDGGPPPPPDPTSDHEQQSLRALQPCPLSLLQSRALLQRVEQKFLCSRSRLGKLLQQLAPHVARVPPQQGLIAAYNTVYYDTPDRQLFHAHRQGRRSRVKVRTRHYLDRKLAVLEQKTKHADGQVTKLRHPHRFGDDHLGSHHQATLAHLGPLEQSAIIRFRRITLVGLSEPERLTLDLDLTLSSGGRHVAFPNVLIVELKQPRLLPRSPAALALRGAGLRATSVSKYAVTMALLDERCPPHAFGSTLHALMRVSDAR